MFDESEWPLLRAALSEHTASVQRHREITGANVTDAVAASSAEPVQAVHVRLTGARAMDIDELWHHQLSSCGPPCSACGKPLRTASASYCAECGASVV
jgi:hypothetical protein